METQRRPAHLAPAGRANDPAHHHRGLSPWEQAAPSAGAGGGGGGQPQHYAAALAQLEQDGLAKADRTAGRLVTQDTAILDAVRRAEAHVVVNQYYHAMAELGYSQQEATAMLKEEEQ